MSQHDKIQHQFYDYIKGELTLHERETIEAHLDSCSMCEQEFIELKELIENELPVPSIMPSDERSSVYWNNFTLEVERRIRATDADRIARPVSFWNWLDSLFTLHKRQVIAIGSSLALVCIAIAVWLLQTTPPVKNAPVQTIAESNQLTDVDKQVNRYLHKSKTLLVGISNLDLARDESLDLTTEKKVSRALVREARYLHDQPLDLHSAKLIDDLEKIQIEIGTMKDNGVVPRIQLVRNGIHSGNLLFKIRMAESMYDAREMYNTKMISTGDKK